MHLEKPALFFFFLLLVHTRVLYAEYGPAYPNAALSQFDIFTAENECKVLVSFVMMMLVRKLVGCVLIDANACIHCCLFY